MMKHKEFCIFLKRENKIFATSQVNTNYPPFIEKTIWIDSIAKLYILLLYQFSYSMPRKKRRTRSSTRIRLTRFHIGALLLIAGALYFFSQHMAAESPIFTILSYPTHQVFGATWSAVFFALLLLFGLITLLFPRYYSKALFKFGFVILVLVCGIVNFEILDLGLGEIAQTTETMNTTIKSHGWRLWYLTLRGTDRLFGGATQASKLFIIAMLVATLIYMAVFYKLKLPSFQVEMVKDRYERASKAVAKAKKKVRKTTEDTSDITHTKENLPVSSDTSSSHTEAQTLKSLIKDKLGKKIQKKEDTQAIKQLHISFPKDKPTFDSSLLTIDVDTWPSVDEERLYKKAQAIKSKLAEFNISVDIEWFNVWPTVLQIKIKPHAWVKVSKIENLKKDLALWMRTKSLRVLAPIPWSDSVWIELPNPNPQMVRFREVIEWLQFTKEMSDNFTNLTIGKGIDGNHVVKSLETMPHLLVAWATGSGKSVWVNGFISSLIYQNTPSELKFIMVDPKQVELGIYEGIPYLMAPIITQADKAVKVLKWAVDYMEERYTLLKKTKVRHLNEYNAKVSDKEKMYRLVIIIDELADLMMTGNKKDTETYITRIAQKARAVGIHLILATQRPSVNVITWLIKANVPTRIAFGVVSQIDSRTILDVKWAEDLVGKWDLLYTDPKTKFPIRVQWPFISTTETEKMVQAINDKYMSNLTQQDIYHPEIMRILENKPEYGGAWSVSDDDEALILQAMDIISKKRKASATMLQRTLWVWFPRAARLIDILEERWIVWPQEWAKPREIYI